MTVKKRHQGGTTVGYAESRI